MIQGIDAKALLADRGYEVNKIIEKAQSMGMEVVIPPKKNRMEQRDYDKDLYKIRHLVENTFLMLKPKIPQKYIYAGGWIPRAS